MREQQKENRKLCHDGGVVRENHNNTDDQQLCRSDQLRAVMSWFWLHPNQTTEATAGFE